MEFLNQPWLYGFLGALIYASGRLSSVVLGEKPPDDRAIRAAYVRFITAILFGPCAAQAFVPTVLDVIHYRARPQALAFAIGLSINAVWPTVERFAWKGFLAWLGQQLKAAGGAMTKEDER